MMFRSIRLVPPLLFLLLLSGRALSQTGDATISGTVAERASGEIVIGATVALYADTAGTQRKAVRGAITNKYGFYSMANVRPGEYFLRASSVGYGTVWQQVRLGADSSVRLNLQLGQQNVELKEVVVQGQKDPSPTATISTLQIKPDFVRKLPSLGGEPDLFRALQLLPGVKASSEISSGLYVRGSSPDENLTLLDGVIVYNPSHLGGFLSTFNADAVRDIKLIKGAFPAEYGGRLSSVLDITMREGTKEKVTGSAGINLVNSRLTVEGPIGDNATFMISGRRFYLDLVTKLGAWITGASQQTQQDIPSYYFYDLNSKVNYKLSDNDRLYLSGYFGRDVLGITQSDLNAGISWGNATVNARWAHIMSSKVFTNFSAIYTDYSFSSLIENKDRISKLVSDGFKSKTGIQDFMLRGELQWAAGEDHNVKVGLEATHHAFRADASLELADFSQIDRSPNIINTFDASLYAQDEWNITPTLQTNVGGRLYYFQDGGYLRFEPRLSLAYALNEDVSLKAAFSMGNQFLHLVSRNDLPLPTDVWFPSTTQIKPSEAMQGVLGFETSLFDHEYLLSVEGYYKRMKNLLDYKDTATVSLNVPLESSFTSGSGEAYGVEVFLNKQLGSFTGWIGYTLSWTNRLFPELNKGQRFYPRYDQRHDISVVLTYKIGDRWEFGATWVYATGQAYTTASGQYALVDPQNGSGQIPQDNIPLKWNYTDRNAYRLPAFHKLDLNFTHSYSWFNLPWQFSINIYNAYSHKNVFSQYLSKRYFDESTKQYVNKVTLNRITLFPIIPTFGLSFKF